MTTTQMPIEEDVAHLKRMVALLMHYAPLEVRQAMLDDADEVREKMLLHEIEFGSVTDMTGLITSDEFESKCRYGDLQGDEALKVFKTMSPHHQIQALRYIGAAHAVKIPVECFNIVFKMLDKCDVGDRSHYITSTFGYTDADFDAVSFDHICVRDGYVRITMSDLAWYRKNCPDKIKRFHRRLAYELARCLWKTPVHCLTQKILRFM